MKMLFCSGKAAHLRLAASACLLFACFAGICAAGDATDTGDSSLKLFNRGNVFYERGEYDAAIGEYEKILARGEESGAVCYNLADSYFKSGQLGRAILNYERALELLPRDADVNANYRFARARIKGKIVPEKGFWAWWALRVYDRNFTVDELTMLSSGMYVFALLFLTVALIRVNGRTYFLAGTALLVVFIVFNSAVIWHKYDRMKTGGVMVKSRVEAMFGPFESATKFFDLYEGMRVDVLKKKEDWYKVRRADGKAGWVREDTVEKLQGYGNDPAPRAMLKM
ncbi:MAG: tetratricopeptide repeat protein [Candidatus Tantalella remota]|nr:tetratricopeptide repeat protein [Candidatus Tantalella remota]